jgi:hypothetical protein
MSYVFDLGNIFVRGMGIAVTAFSIGVAAAMVAHAQPAGPPGGHPDRRSEWQRQSDWIWRSSRQNQYRHRSNPVGPHWGAPWYGSGSTPVYPFGWGGSFGPMVPPMWDPGFVHGQQAPPPGGTDPYGLVPPPQVDAESARTGPVDPGSRRYVNRWQRSGRGYIHVFGWEWTSNGVKQQQLHRVFIDRNELADPMMLESVPAAPPDAPHNGSDNGSDKGSRAAQERHTDAWFKSLDADGDGTVSREEFGKAVEAVGTSGFPG